MSKRIGWSVAFFAVAFGLASAARADIIMYTESFQATGTLGGQSFTDQSVTLTAFGDTSTLFSTPSIAEVDAVTSTVAINGVATANFTDSLNVFVVYGFGGIFGFTDPDSSTGGDILDVRASPFLTYDLISPIGPIAGSFADYFSLNNPTGTSAGDLVFTSVADSVIVTASAVPEPSSLVLVALGFLGTVCYARRLW
jgi:hypothetical protein